jgi:tRNA (guanine10-N2)-methyltransferase
MVKYLVQFLDEWIDFRISELISLLELAQLSPIDVIYSWRCVGKVMDTQQMSREYNQFLQLYRESFDYEKANDPNPSKSSPNNPSKPFLIIDLPQTVNIPQVFGRGALIKSVFELWAEGETLSEIIERIHSLPPDFLNPFLESKKTWSLQIESFGKTFKLENKHQIRNYFMFLQFQGEVSLKSPQIELWTIMDYSAIHSLPVVSTISVNDPDYLADLLQKKDCQLYFGRKVYDNTEMKKYLAKYNLQKRIYIGPTSLDHVLAMVLANLAQTKNGMIAYEPFMGTGSIPIALEHFGCFCMGSDIDPRVLRGEMYAGHKGSGRQEINEKILNKKNNDKTEGSPQPVEIPQKEGVKLYRIDYLHPKKVNCEVRSNFIQYQLPIPELIRMDQHLIHRHFQEKSMRNFFDVIVTDPPYGIRAGARKSGKKNNSCDYEVEAEKRMDHIPSTQNYPVEEVMLDLLHTAAETLVV